MIEKVKDLFTPISFPENEVKNRISSILNVFWKTIWALAGLNLFGILFIFARKTGASVFLGFFIVILFIVRYFHRRGKVRLAAFLFVFGLWSAYMTIIVLSGTIRTSVIALPIVITAMVIPLLGFRVGITFVLITLFITLGITLFEISGNPLPVYFPRQPLSNWFHLLSAFVIIIVPLGQAWKDISKALALARKEKEFTEHALNSLKDTIFVFDSKTGESIRWNKAVNDIYGYSNKEIESMRAPYDFISKGDFSQVEAALQRVPKEEYVTAELTVVTKTGQKIPTEYTATTIRDHNDQVQYFIAVGRDLSIRNETELALQKTENKHRLLFEEANDGIFILEDSRVADCNTKILEMFRAERDEIIGKRPYEFSPEFQANGKQSVEMEQEMLKAALAGERQFFEWKHLRMDNTEFDTEISLSILDLGREKVVQAIVRDVTRRKLAEKQLVEAYETTLEGWAKALELRDKETEDHSRRVVDLTVSLAKKFNIKDEEMIHIRRGAILHDIGKMGVPDEILLKPGKLTQDERKIIEQHPIYNHQLLSQIPYLAKSMDIPYSHHERWDGTGYPQGLIGEGIPFAARMFAIIDVWDALNSDRPYRKAWKRAEIINHIKNESGKHFDPKIVEVFLEYIDKEVQ